MMSPAGHEFGGDASRMSGGVGSDLRIARERLGWTLPAIAAQLRIRLPYLEAIEEGRLADLPGNAYAVGFLRTYAGSVGLDPDEIARRFRAETADLNRRTELSFPAPVPERGVPAGAVVMVGVVLVVAAYVGWYRLSGDRGPQVAVVQPVPERLAPLDGTVTPVPPPAVPVPVPVPMPTPQQLASALQPNATQPSAPPPAPAPAVPQPSPPGVPAPFAAAAPVPSAPAPAPLAGTPPAPDGGRLVVRAKAEAWVQVRDKSGPVVFNRTMRAGETWPVPNKPGLLMTVGNAGGTEVLMDGVATASLGADGAVRRDLSLDLDQVRDGKLAAVVPAPSAAPKPAPPKLP